MNQSILRQMTRTLSQALVDIQKPKEAEAFLKDFFNESELETIIKRLATIYWIKKNRDESNIIANLSVNKKAIANAKILLKKPGVTTLIKKIEAEEWANVWAEKIKKITK